MSPSKNLLLLEDLKVREKSLRTLQYGIVLLIPAVPNKRQAFEKLSGQVSLARVVLRLFDDCPALYSTLSYGYGRQEEALLVRALTIVENVAGQLYLLVEHFAFMQDIGFLSGTSEKAWRYCISLWAVTLVTAIMKSALRKREVLRGMGKLGNNERKTAKKELESLSWSLVMYCGDLLNALSFLGIFPFRRRLSLWTVGLLGSLSSVVGLMKLLRMKT